MKKWIFVIQLSAVIISIFFISGYRFTALSAAQNNAFLTKDVELIEQYNTGSSVIFLFENDEEEIYETILSEKSGVFFHRSSATYIPDSSDKIKTIGAISFTIESDSATLLSVISHDEEIAYVEAGVEPNIKRKEINTGERVDFLFPFSEQIDFLHPSAFNKAGNKLYYYGYPKETNVWKSEDLKWHKIDVQ